MLLTTTREVIAELGGVRAVAELTRRNYDAAWKWTKFPHFPANTYIDITRALEAKGHTAPASLWRMVQSGSAS